MSELYKDPWFICPKPRPDSRFRLFCLPFAGGGASAYRSWFNTLPDSVELCAVQMPGHETRLREDRITSATELSTAIASAMLPYLDRPFAMFGFSLGGLLAFEVIRELRRRSARLPVHLFAVSARAPQSPPVHPPIAELPKDDFIEMIDHYYRPEDEAWTMPEMLDMFLPVLRDDIMIVDTYCYVAEPPLPCSIDVFVGASDLGAPIASAGQWREQTSTEFEMAIFNGGHFFFQKEIADIEQKVYHRLSNFIS